MPIRFAIRSLLASLALCLSMGVPCAAVDGDLAAFSKIGSEGAGHAEAIAAAKRLSKLGPDRLIEVLSAIEEATPLGKNWLRVLAADIADNGALPVAPLAEYVKEASNSRDARYAAYLLLKDADVDTANALLDGMLNDPSLQLRHEAVAKVLQRAEAADGEAGTALYRQALDAARHPGQLTKAAEGLREAGREIDLAGHMGFIRNWNLVAPFDNTDSKGFDVVYPPESEYLSSASHTISQASYAGKEGPVSWLTHANKDELGMVNLNPIFSNAKSAVSYGYVELQSPKAQPAQVRLGCIVANKIWVNGELVMTNEIYHARTGVDQYIDDFPLKAGKNTLLVKICQNDQPQSWAQDWEFQLRITDPDGEPIRLED